MASSASDLQARVVRVLEAPGALQTADGTILPTPPVVAWRKKDSKSNLDASLAAQKGLCIFVLRPTPTSAMQGTPFVYFDGYELRVQIIELPDVNQDNGADLDDLVDAVALALHWQPKSPDSPLAGILAHPLYLAPRPVETAEGRVAVPGFEHDGEMIRGADVIFNAVLQIKPQS